MVADDVASRSVWLGADGALAGAKPGAVVVESSTLTPDWVRELAGHARAKGCGFLDAPVGGSRLAAASGELRLFVGGDAATLDKARPALVAIGSKIDLLGPAGAGATWKLINNQLIAAQIAALAEALDVARKAGFRPVQISSLILNGAALSPIVKLKLPSMLAGDFEPTDFALHLMLKDARYATALAQSLGAPADMISGAVKAFARAEAKGLGAKDIAAVAG
jgi:3-hydroxyisobutyrate dehydrogenase